MADTTHGPMAAYRRWGHAAEREAQRVGRAVVDLFPEAGPSPRLHDGDERYTTRATDAWCRRKAGVRAWDLDVAACEEAHLAPRYYTRAQDGLRLPWGGRVWCNPPFSDVEAWVQAARLWQGRCRVIAQLLPATRTEQPWWQRMVEPFRDRPGTGLTSHFLPERTRFGLPGNPEGIGVGSPPFGCVLLVWRRP